MIIARINAFCIWSGSIILGKKIKFGTSVVHGNLRLQNKNNKKEESHSDQVDSLETVLLPSPISKFL
jgi:hypothetical protein